MVRVKSPPLQFARMNEIVGIDLGTTNSLIGVMDAGFPILIADKNGARLTPSVVHFPADGTPLVGQPATRMRALKPAQTIYSSKRFMGLRGDDLRESDADVSYQLERKSGKALRIAARGESHSPEEISALILGKLKADAETALGHPVSRAVITVPAYFNDAQRGATKRAGELAGFTVERIVNEPTAAALAYGLGKLKEKSKIAVYDLGGGTFDLSILELNEGVFQVLATNGNTRLGGDDLDKRMVEFLVDKISAAGGPDLSGRCRREATEKIRLSKNPPPHVGGYSEPTILPRLREAAEAAKIRLSTET